MPRRESSAIEYAVSLVQSSAKNITEAAEASGVSRSAVVRALRRRGVEPAAPGRPPKPPVPDPEPYYFHGGKPPRAPKGAR